MDPSADGPPGDGASKRVGAGKAVEEASEGLGRAWRGFCLGVVAAIREDLRQNGVEKRLAGLHCELQTEPADSDDLQIGCGWAR